MARKMPVQKPGQSEQTVCTPIEFLDAVKAKLGIRQFVLDCAASKENTVARAYFTEQRSALTQPEGRWVMDGWDWCNPPYSDIAPWVTRAAFEKYEGALIAMLVPASVGANWWKEYVHHEAQVHFLNGRITFVGHSKPYPKDCALLLYGNDLTPGYHVWTWKKETD